MATATTPGSAAEFLALYRKSGLYDEKPFRDAFTSDADLPTDARPCAAAVIQAGLLTSFQAKQLLAGRHRGLVLGTHRILEPIGQGGMGQVFLAEHTGLRRKVALKVLPIDKAKDKLTLERFHREARAAAALSHPNIVRLHDVSQGGGVHFLVMEFVEGNDLQSLMARTGPLHYAQAVSYIAQAAAGLAHAHERGIVHRDIKPSNLILGKDGVVKLLDMGLARSLTSVDDDLTGTLGAGEVAGTADYMAPEQALCEPSDERADIYSLGATLYALVAGHPPFAGTTSQKLAQHQMREPPNLAKKLAGRVPPALAEVVAAMMAKRPADRYQTAEDVVDALGPWLPAPTTGSVAGARLDAPVATRRGPRPAARAKPGPPRWALAAAAAAVAVLAAGGGAYYLLTGDAPTRPPAGGAPVAAATNPAARPDPSAFDPSVAELPFRRDPLPALPGDEQFTRVSLAEAFNVPSTRLKFAPEVFDALVCDDWSDRRVEGVPFALQPPESGKFNVVEMYGPSGLAAQMPKSVRVPVGVPAGKLHFLSGVGAWGFPCPPQGGGQTPLGSVVLRVVIRYADDTTEEHSWQSGVHFCDYSGRHVVAESKRALEFRGRRSVRYLAIEPASGAAIREIEFVKNEADSTAPLILAVTAESAKPGQARKPAPAAAGRTVIPLQLPVDLKQPEAPVPPPDGAVSFEGVTFEATGGCVVLGPAAESKLSCFLAVKAVHVLGAVGPAGPGAGAGLVKVRLHYPGGQTEDHDWRVAAGTPVGGLRAATFRPKRTAVVQHVSFVNAGPTTPVIYAVAVEPN